jgi:hypothetical protein
MSTVHAAVRRSAVHSPLQFMRALGTLLLATLVLVLPQSAGAATARVTQDELCAAWNEPASGPQVELASGYEIAGAQRTRTGASCTSPGASVTITNSTISEQPVSSGASATSRLLATAVRTAVGTGDIKVGDEIFKGAVIKSLTAVLQGGYVGIRGGVEVSWSGGTVTKLQFNGRFYDVDRYSLALTSPSDGTLLPNVGGAPINFRGSLVRDSAGFRLNVTGTVSQLVLGSGAQQLTVTPSSLNLTLADTNAGSGLALAVSGGIAIGSSVQVTDGALDLAFDDAGLARLTGGGGLALDLPASGSAPATAINGTAKVSYERGQDFGASFSGDVKIGDALVADAAGSLDAQGATFRGQAQYATAELAAKGAVEGAVYYGDDLAGRTIRARSGQQVAASKGDALLQASDAELTTKGLTVRGSAQIGAVGGERWVKASGAVDTTFSSASIPATSLKGSASIDWVQGSSPAVSFSGSVAQGDLLVASASGSVDGNSLSLDGQVKVTIDGNVLEGAVSGSVVYGADTAGVTIPGKDGAKVPAQRGDYALKAAAGAKLNGQVLAGSVGFGRAGGVLWSTLGGKVDLTFGTTRVTGSTDIAWSAGSAATVEFEGSLTTPTTTIAGKGTISGNVLKLSGTATYAATGVSARGVLDATAYLGDPAGATLPNASGAQVPAERGDYVLRGASAQITAKNLTLSGELTLGKVAGQSYARGGGGIDLAFGSPVTTIKGSASFAWASDAAGSLAFDGTVVSGDTSLAASGVIDGKKLAVSGQLSSPTLSGRAQGVVYYGTDLAGETITNRTGKVVPATRGDLSLTVADGRVVLKQLTASANFSLKKVGGVTWADADAQLKVGTTFLSFKGQLDSTGTVNLAGSGSTTLGGYKVDFSGTALIKNNALTLDGTVVVTTGLFKVQLTGTILKPDMNTSDFTFIGKASFQFAQFKVVDATVRLTTGEGLATTFSVKSCVLFICVNGSYKLYFSGGEVSKIQLSAPLTSWPIFRGAALLVAPGVPVESTITGLF